MKKTLFLSLLLLPGGYALQAQKIKKHSDAATVAPKQEVDWSQFVNLDFVADGQINYDVKKIRKGTIIQVRFYERGLKPMDLGTEKPYKISAYKVGDNSDVLSVKALFDGGISVILATGNKEGPFVENINVMNPTTKGYVLTIRGIVEDFNQEAPAVDAETQD